MWLVSNQHRPNWKRDKSMACVSEYLHFLQSSTWRQDVCNMLCTSNTLWSWVIAPRSCQVCSNDLGLNFDTYVESLSKITLTSTMPHIKYCLIDQLNNNFLFFDTVFVVRRGLVLIMNIASIITTCGTQSFKIRVLNILGCDSWYCAWSLSVHSDFEDLCGIPSSSHKAPWV
jgi:hypothetical protein